VVREIGRRDLSRFAGFHEQALPSCGLSFHGQRRLRRRMRVKDLLSWGYPLAGGAKKVAKQSLIPVRPERYKCQGEGKRIRVSNPEEKICGILSRLAFHLAYKVEGKIFCQGVSEISRIQHSLEI
jgi:hypothetical protein